MLKKISRSVLVVVALASCATNPNQEKLANMNCEQHKEFAMSLNDFSAKVFDGGYANIEDPTSAMAQLFLIQQRGPGDYSRKINGAEQDYQDILISAKRKKCDISNYPISPIHEFEKRTNELVSERNKAGWTPKNHK